MVRDLDRKVVSVAAGSTPYLQIYDETGYVLLETPLTLTSADQGLWAVNVERSSIPDWTTKPYQYAVYIKDMYGVRYPLYTDRGRTATGVCRVVDGPVPPPRQPMNINSADFILRDSIAYSEAYAGAATVNNPSGQASAAFYCTDFSGVILIEGSLDMNISTEDNQWFVVETMTIAQPQTGVIGQAFTGNFTYVRFAISSASGTVDQIIYTV